MSTTKQDPAEVQRAWATKELEEVADRIDAAIFLLRPVADADPCYQPLIRAQDAVSLSRMERRLKGELSDIHGVIRMLRK